MISGNDWTLFRRDLPLTVVTILFLVSYCLVFPHHFLMRSDAFGYFDSLVRTLWDGTLRVSDWLGPSNVGFTAMGWAVFKLTGNFFVATFGVVFVSYLAAAWLMRKIFADAAIPPRDALILTLVLFANPYLLNKGMDFNGMATYLLCFLAALYAWNRSVALFCVATILTFTIRQSAISLLALPLFDVLQRRSPWKKLALTAGLFVFLIALDSKIPKGFNARSYATLSWMLVHLNPRAMGATVAVALTNLLPWTLLAQRLAGRPLFPLRKKNLTIGAALSLGLLAASGFHPTTLAPAFNAPVVGLAIRAYPLLLVIPFFLDFDAIFFNRYAFVAAASIGLLALKGDPWDYYLTESTALWLLALAPAFTETARPRGLGWCGFYGLLTWLALGFCGMRVMLARSGALYRSYELAFRDRKLTPSDGSEMPWGLLGWKFHDYYVRVIERTGIPTKDPCQLCMAKYVRKGASYFEALPATSPFGPLQSVGEEEVASGTMSVLFRPWHYRLVKSAAGESRSIGPFALEAPGADYDPRCAPLDEAEWETLIRAGRFTCAGMASSHRTPGK